MFRQMAKYAFVPLVWLVLQKASCAVLKNDGQEDQLVAVVTLFRHGDRAPTKSFPNDPYFNESYWPMGHGQLTDAGKKRMYELGKWFRKRYSSFLPEEYSPKDIYVRSTDRDRCLMSAYAVLAGLFPPKPHRSWNRDLQWQPIPVHTVPIDKDEVLSMRKRCPKYINLFEKTMISDYVKKITSKFYDFFHCIARYSGWGEVDISHVAKLQTNLDVYSSYNKSFIPPWALFLDKKVLVYLAAVNHQRFTLTPALKRLLTGPFWSNLLAHFDNVVNGVEGTSKFLILSAHDTTIVSILNCVEAYDFSPPNFGATLIWEMKRSRNGAYYINLFYKKSETEVEKMSLGKYGLNCEYKDFKDLLGPLVVDGFNWEEECEDVTHISRPKPEKKPFFV